MKAFGTVSIRARIGVALFALAVSTLAIAAAAVFGTLRLRSDVFRPEERSQANLLISLVLASSGILGALLSIRFARLILEPIARLARTARLLSSGRDFTRRLEKQGDDELGELVDAFNDVVSQTQAGDAALRIARADLESRVVEGHAQLESVRLERQRAEESARRNEAQYRRLVDLLPDAVVIQSEGRLAYVNSAAVTLFGAASPAQLVGRPVLDFVPRESREEMISRIKRAYESSRRNRLYEERLARLDGSMVDVEVASILFTHEGKPAVLVILRDITQRKEIERMKNEFVATVSHELRTPMTSIQGSLGLIANGVMGALPAAAQPLVDIAYRNCQRLVLLINDILDVEKIAAGKMRFSFKPVDVGPLVEQSVEANRGYAAGFGVAFVLRNDAPAARVNADSDRLFQVFTNLLSNAAKFSPRGETVTVSVTPREGSVRVEVVDRGPGIPEEFRDRIFQKFSQADSTDIRQKGGTGLGLAICKTIVDRHEGQIAFETESGGGTRFFVDLPLVADRHHTRPRATRSRSRPGCAAS